MDVLKVLAECKQMRREGWIERTLSIISMLIEKEPITCDIAEEALAVLVENAMQSIDKDNSLIETTGKFLYYLASCADIHNRSFMCELLTRSWLLLSQKNNDNYYPGILNHLPVKSKWLLYYNATLEDPSLPIALTDLAINLYDQTAVITLSAHCQSCDNEFQLKVYHTLMVERTLLCPHCFASYFINYDLIQPFLQCVSDEVDFGFTEFQDKIKRLKTDLNEDAIDGLSYPLLARYQNLNVIYTLNELLYKRITQAYTPVPKIRMFNLFETEKD